MLGSSVTNLKQHVGLQQLSALAGITHSSLGPNKTFKFIQDDTRGQSALACSCLHILENMELTCALGQLVYETLQAHHKVYNTGSGCLLFLAGAWSRAALECLHRGISVSNIISAMSEGLDVCLGVCSKFSISTDAALCTGTKRQVPKGKGNVSDMTLNINGQRKMKLSRYFYEVESKNELAVTQSNQPKRPDIANIAEGLRHGCVSAMNLVLEASRVQSQSHQDTSNFTFDITKVMTCVLPGLPEERACVIPGCVALLSAEQASLAHNLKERTLKLALIEGDLSHTFRHLGFHRPAGIQRVSDQSALLLCSDGEEEWTIRVMTLLRNLEVNLIITSGHVSEKVMQHCCRHGVLLVEKVKSSALRSIASVTGGVPVTYATQLTKHCVGTGVKVTIWQDLSGTERNSSTVVNISTSGNSSLVTVILTSCVHGKLEALEGQFWACAYRLHYTLKDKVILPGAGVIDMLCVQHLQKQADHYTEKTCDSTQRSKPERAVIPYRGVVLRLMADGLIDYISTVMANTGRFSKVRAWTLVSEQLQDRNGHGDIAAEFSQLLLEGENEDSSFLPTIESNRAPALKIYDNLSVKQEAWRKALDLVFLVLQTDAEVITGVDEKAVAHDNLMLL